MPNEQDDSRDSDSNKRARTDNGSDDVSASADDVIVLETVRRGVLSLFSTLPQQDKIRHIISCKEIAFTLLSHSLTVVAVVVEKENLTSNLLSEEGYHQNLNTHTYFIPCTLLTPSCDGIGNNCQKTMITQAVTHQLQLHIIFCAN